MATCLSVQTRALKKPEDLIAQRVCTVGYGMSASTWVLHEYEETRRRMGKNYWKYGIEANRKELQSIMRYVYEQGLVKRQVNFEDLFDPSTMNLEEDIK